METRGCETFRMLSKSREAMKGHITASIPMLLKLLSDQLYSEPEVFLRELICNSFDAIQRMYHDLNTKIIGRILVRGDGKRSIEVRDNGIGMKESDLIDFLSCIGKSAIHTATCPTIGRFGLGFLSVLAVAERVEVDTLYVGIKVENSYQWIWQGGESYTIIPSSIRYEHGTVVRIELKDEYAGYAKPEFLSLLVKEYVPFLSVLIEVPPYGDPRPFNVPWIKNFPILKKPIEESIWEDGIHCFECCFPAGGGGIFIFPKSNYKKQGTIRVYQKGVLIAKKLGDFLPSNWDWITGLVDIPDGTLTLNRAGLKKDLKFNKIQKIIETQLKEELISLCKARRNIFQCLIEQHRDKIIKLISKDPELFNKIGYYYQFYTTLGRLSFKDLLEHAELKRDKRIIQYINIDNPLSDYRWSKCVAEHSLLIWCQYNEEEYLLNQLIRATFKTESIRLGYGLGPIPPLPPVPDEIQRWGEEIKTLLAKEALRLELKAFTPDNIISIVQQAGYKSLNHTECLEDESVWSIFKKEIEKIRPEKALGTLIINFINKAVIKLAEDRTSAYPLELVVALLLTKGIVQTRIPIGIQWHEVIDKLINKGIEKLTNIRPSSEKHKHIICFFAHEFEFHKPLLSALRKVLEYEPYFWEVRSADDRIDNPLLFNSIKQQIENSHVFLAEITHENPNVFLELGLAFGSEKHHAIILLVEKHVQRRGDLQGHLVYRYEPNALQGSQSKFIHKFNQWLATHSNLKGFKGERPFLAFRLLVKKGIINENEKDVLAYSFSNDAYAFLSLSAREISAQINIPEIRIREAQEYFNRRITIHHGYNSEL